MAEPDDPDTDTSELAREVIRELDPGTVIDDKYVLSRRQVIALSTGALSIGALAGFGSGEASAQQAAGQVGTDSEPVEVFASNFASESVSGGYELTIDGDTYKFNV